MDLANHNQNFPRIVINTKYYYLTCWLYFDIGLIPVWSVIAQDVLTVPWSPFCSLGNPQLP